MLSQHASLHASDPSISFRARQPKWRPRLTYRPGNLKVGCQRPKSEQPATKTAAPACYPVIVVPFFFSGCKQLGYRCLKHTVGLNRFLLCLSLVACHLSLGLIPRNTHDVPNSHTPPFPEISHSLLTFLVALFFSLTTHRNPLHRIESGGIQVRVEKD